MFSFSFDGNRVSTRSIDHEDSQTGEWSTSDQVCNFIYREDGIEKSVFSINMTSEDDAVVFN